MGSTDSFLPLTIWGYRLVRRLGEKLSVILVDPPKAVAPQALRSVLTGAYTHTPFHVLCTFPLAGKKQI